MSGYTEGLEQEVALKWGCTPYFVKRFLDLEDRTFRYMETREAALTKRIAELEEQVEDLQSKGRVVAGTRIRPPGEAPGSRPKS